MDEASFREYLGERGLKEEDIEPQLDMVRRFERYLADQQPPLTLELATAAQVRPFVDQLIDEGANSFDNLLALARYGRFCGNNVLYLALLELLDGSEALDTLYARLTEELGPQRRDGIFDGRQPPPLGTPSLEKARFNREVMARLERAVDAGTVKRLLSGCLRYLEDEWFVQERENYAKCGNIDKFIELKHREFISELEKHQREGTLFFNQPITPEVLDYVRADPETEGGVRRGDTLFVSKIPYLAAQYLAATDDRLKRYYYCHCPWARESLRKGEQPVSATFCYCSGGFHKKMWEVIFEQPLEVEVLESVLKGDLRCRFAIKLPREALPESEA